MIIELPWSKPPLSQNDRDERKRGGARKIAAAKAEACEAVRNANPLPVVGANVWLHYRVPDRRRRDADNLAVVLKVCQDALVVEGVLPADDWIHVPRSGCQIHEPSDLGPALWLELTDLHHYDTAQETP